MGGVCALRLRGLTDQNSVSKIQKCLQSRFGSGLLHCDIDLSQGQALIGYDTTSLVSSPGQLIEAIVAADANLAAWPHPQFETAVRGGGGSGDGDSCRIMSVSTKEKESSSFQGWF